MACGSCLRFLSSRSGGLPTTLALALCLAAAAALATGVSGVSIGANPARSASLHSSQVSSRLAAAGEQGHMCTFQAFLVQLCERGSASPAAYVQVNKIWNADGSTFVDIRAQRPPQAYNSYQRLRLDEAWQVASLAHGDALSITWTGVEGMTFAYGDVRWTEGNGYDGGDEAWCESTGWFDGGDDWTCASGNEKRARVCQRQSTTFITSPNKMQKKNLVCGFLCAPMERPELS